MFSGKKILGLIMARGGSKGLPRKNLRELHGKPMLAWTILAARESKYLDRLVISTDSTEIIETAQRFGCEAPFVRAAHLATDESPVIDAVLDALEQVGADCEYLVLLQPTSPLRRTEDIDACIELCVGQQLPSVVTVSQLPKPASFYGAIDPAGILNRNGPPAAGVIGTPCMLNGAVYVAAVDLVRRHRSFIVPGTVAHLMPFERSWDVDSLFDFLIADVLFPFIMEDRIGLLKAVRTDPALQVPGMSGDAQAGINQPTNSST